MELNMNAQLDLYDFTGKLITEKQVKYILTVMRNTYVSYLKDEPDKFTEAFIDTCSSTLDLFERNLDKLPDARDYLRIFPEHNIMPN